MYLKSPEFNTVDPLLSNAGVLPLTFDKPVLSAEPSLYEKELSPTDRFLIFASDGLWDMMSDQEAVDIVQKGPRKVSHASSSLFYHTHLHKYCLGIYWA